MTVAARKVGKWLYDSGSHLEAKFVHMWRVLDGPPLHREHHFHPERKWRMDFAHIGARVGIEIQGGLYSNGGHVRPTGYEGDCEKYNAAHLRNWAVFLLTPKMLDDPALIEDIIAFIRERAERNQ